MRRRPPAAAPPRPPLALAPAVALVLAGLLAAGCSDGRREGAVPPSAPSVSPSPSGATVTAPGTGPGPSGEGTATGSATGNGPAVCAAARAVSSRQASTFVTELTTALSGDGDAAVRARRAAGAALRDWSAGLRAQAARADDARLGGLLTDLAAEVGTMTADIDSIDGARLDALQQRLDELCGG